MKSEFNQTLVNNSAQPSPQYIALYHVAELEKELAVAEERKNGLDGQLDHLSDRVDDLRKRLDQSEGRITALLSEQRQKSFFKRILGNYS